MAGAESPDAKGESLFEQLHWVLSESRAATALVFVPTSVPVGETAQQIRAMKVPPRAGNNNHNSKNDSNNSDSSSSQGSAAAAAETFFDAVAVYEHVHLAQSPRDAADRRQELLDKFAAATPHAPVVGVCNMDAVRGLDIPNVELACIVGTPRTHIDYLHIVGRVGRGGAPGTAVLFAYDALQSKRADVMARKLSLELAPFSPSLRPS